MILKCAFDPGIESWVMSGESSGVGGEASLVLSDVRISVDVIDPSKIVEIAVFCGPEKHVPARSLEYLRLLLGEGFAGPHEGAQIDVQVKDLPVFQASKMAQTIALMELENVEFRLRGLDIVQFGQALGGHAEALLEGYVWELLPAVTGLGHALKGNPALLDWWPPAARNVLHMRATAYLQAIQGNFVEHELMDDIEWLALLSAPAPDDVSSLVVDRLPTVYLSGAGMTATRSEQSEILRQEDDDTGVSVVQFDEPETFRPRLGRDTILFGRGPILLEVVAGFISSVRIPLKAGVSTFDLLDIRLRLVERGTYKLIHDAPLSSVIDPATGKNSAIADIPPNIPGPAGILLDLSNVRLPVITKSAQKFVFRHRAAVAARRALIAERGGRVQQTEEMWRLCRQSMRVMGESSTGVDTLRRIIKAELTSAPDWLAPIVHGWEAYAQHSISKQADADQRCRSIEGTLREVAEGLGEGPTLALLRLNYALHLAEHGASELSNDEVNELIRISLDGALTLFLNEQNDDRVQQCLQQLSRIR